jgi:hypothetical protein
MAVKFTAAKTPTQASRVPTETPLLDKGTPSGVSQAWIRHFESTKQQQPFNPIAVVAALSPLIVDAIHNVLFITTGAAAFSLILGQSKSSPFSIYVIIKADAGAGAITVSPAPGDTINGAGPLALTPTRWRATILIPDGNHNWEAFSIAGGG